MAVKTTGFRCKGDTSLFFPKTCYSDTIMCITYLQSLLIRLAAFLDIFLGKSMESMPLSIMLYVLIGSAPVNGGLKKYKYM